MHPLRTAANWLVRVTIATAILVAVALLADPARSTADEGAVFATHRT